MTAKQTQNRVIFVGYSFHAFRLGRFVFFEMCIYVKLSYVDECVQHVCYKQLLVSTSPQSQAVTMVCNSIDRTSF